jgi:CUB domain.
VHVGQKMGVWIAAAVTMKESVSPNLAGIHYSCYFVSAGCGGVLSGLSGSLQYPHSGSIEYSHNVNCAWLIITNTTKVLQLNFTKFDVEHSTNCEFDFLQVQYPPPPPRISMFGVEFPVFCSF